MSEILPLSIAAGAGVALGAGYFGGLWWTVLKGVSSPTPALWFLGSLLLRTSLAMTGFYFASGGQWKRLLAALAGFFAARIIVMRVIRTPQDKAHGLESKVRHAP
ncbi:ATP synthase subunit I [Methylocapsa palsarum]|uniref:F1/F0 ATPase, subunit 2 n=1 Tax=Methylocapsa palsarum TaxID=1612308 RepID=A0A1I4CV47_9HYPH|nr:ATP synthase subunit I [Methylocapsa palsarum]SFK84199.1 F1/F0 ATPase, subunit 2 [Methylocapsa palsarum]